MTGEILTREQALEIYYYLRLNRSLEELLARLFRQNKVFGGFYGSLGQEAVSVGAAYALAPGDWIAPMIRNIGALLVRGFRPREILMQHMGKADSPTHGKEGTNHLGDLQKRRVIAPTSVLGDLIPVMAGVAMASRYLGQKNVALTWIGDGGTSTGAFHEGMNLAAVEKAELVVILENNQWAYSTPVSKQVPLRDLAERAVAYGVFHAIVDGNDVVAVVDTVRQAVARARDGKGPVLVEAKTMRMVGHAQHDSAAYVPQEMMAYWKARDPIAGYEKYLSEKNLWSEKDKPEIEARVQRELNEELAAAEASPFPAPETAAQGVYCDGCHSIEPQWNRPKEELLPPKSNTRAAWDIEDFGAFQPSADSSKPPADIARARDAAPEQIAKRRTELIVAETTYLEAIRQALAEEMERDPSVLLLGEDIGVYGGAFQATAGLLARFGWERVVDTPISEAGVVGAAAGMSYVGLRPVVEMQFMDFVLNAFEQIANVLAKSHYRWGAPAPVVIRGPAGGGVHGGPFHSGNPEAYFVHTPGLKVVYPATAYDAKGLLKSAIRDNNPVLFLEHKLLYRRIKEDLPDQEYTVPLGQAIIRRHGRDLTIATYAAMVHVSLEAAERLAGEGIEAEVLDLRTLWPMDREALVESVRRTNKLLVVQEDTKTGGIAGEIAALINEYAFEDLDGPIRRVAALDTPVPFSPPLEQYFLPDAERVAAAARDLARY